MAIILFAHNFIDNKGLWNLYSVSPTTHPGPLGAKSYSSQGLCAPSPQWDQHQRGCVTGQSGRGNIAGRAQWGAAWHRECREPRRTGGLGRRSNHVTTPWAGETAGSKDRPWRPSLSTQSSEDWGPKGRVPGTTWYGPMGYHWLSWDTSTPLAMLTHLWVFRTCFLFSHLCALSVFWNTPLHTTLAKVSSFKTVCLACPLTTVYKGSQIGHPMLFSICPNLPLTAPLCPLPLAPVFLP